MTAAVRADRAPAGDVPVADGPAADGPVAPVGVPAPDGGDRRRVARAGGWTAAGFAVSLVVSPGLTVVLVRVLPAAAYARLATAVAVVTVAGALTGFGLSSAVAQAMARASVPGSGAGPDATYAAARRLAAELCVAAAAVGAAAVGVVDLVPALHPAVGPLVAMVPVVVLAPVLGLGIGTARAGFAGRTVAAVSTVPAVVTAVVTLAALAAGSRSPLVMGAARTAGALAAVALVARFLARRRGGDRPAPIAAPVRRRLAALAGAMLLTSVFAGGISQLDVLVLAAVHGGGAAGAYAPVSRVADALLALPAVMGGFFLPAAARSIAGGGRTETARLYHWASRWNLAVCAPALGVALAVPRSVLTLLFGAGYAAYGGPLRILAAGVAVHVLLGYNGLVLDAYGMPGAVAVRQGVAVAVDAVACVVLVPAWGIDGAAVATSVAVVVANLLCSWSLFARRRIGPWDRAVASTAVAAVAATAVAALLVPHLVGSDAGRIAAAGLLVAVATGAGAAASGGVAERRTALGRVRGHVGAVLTGLSHGH